MNFRTAARKLSSFEDNDDTYIDALGPSHNDTSIACCSRGHNVVCPQQAILFTFYLSLLNLYYIPVIIIFGFVGNILSVLVLLTTHLKLRSSSYYLAALAIADTGYLVCILFVYFASYDILDWLNRRGCCQFFLYVSYVCSCLSVWLIVAFTVERFIAVHYPLKKPYICTVSRAKCIIISLTLTALFAHLYIFVIADVVDDLCQLDLNYKQIAEYINYVDTFATLLVPVVLIVGMNAMIANSLFRFRRKMQKEILEESLDSEQMGFYRGSSSQTTSSTKKSSKDSYSLQDLESSVSKKVRVAKICQGSRQNSNIHIKKATGHAMHVQQNINKMLLVISSVFIALNSPSYLVRFFVYFEELLDGYIAQNYFICIQQLAMLLYYTNFSINFLLYTMCGETFRLCLRAFFKNIFCKSARKRANKTTK